MVRLDNSAYEKLLASAAEPAMQTKTIEYLAGYMRGFVKRGDRVLICFPDHAQGSIGWLMEQAAKQCGGVPVIWGPDRRWKSLLQQAFYSHASTIIGPPLVILGLTKLKKYNGIPLYIRHVVTAGYPCMDWMIDGIQNGLDCSSWGSFGIGMSGVVAGFSCGKSRGVHLRDDMYGVDIVDDDGNVLADGEMGEMVLYLKEDPQARVSLGENGRIEGSSCSCGGSAVRLMDMQPGKVADPDLIELSQYLHSWTSVLDCQVNRGDYGLEMELIVFPGEKLPKLPSAARQVIRPWDPKHDEPFSYTSQMKNVVFSGESH